ncbi:MAG: hypothetical protein D6806_09505 [Deltaproteobacteria bacterium]|nr:MAG: hypothetical protein D6806_09505 [Deltaproteobacteria bacterium]
MKLDEKKLDFDELREDFLAFLRKFPKSRFYPEMELRFVARWVGKLLGANPGKPEDLLRFAEEVKLLKSRFPHLAELERVMSHFGELCLAVLEKAEIGDLEAMKMVRRVEKSCDSVLPAGIRTVKVRKRLDDTQRRLERQLADKREKAELRGFEFFRMWDDAIRDLRWGSTRDDFARRGKFAGLWKEGQDAGEDCQCTFDPESPCRLFEPDAEHGGYEVVARFFNDRLYGIDLCNLMVTTKLPAVYRFLSRRYRPAHSRSAATRFLEAATGTLRFEGRQLAVWLDCRQGICTLRVAEKKAWEKKRRLEDEMRRDRQREIEQRRRQRLERGWKPEDCVEWSCGAACTARGKVVRAEGKRYLVLVDRNPEEPLQAGRRIWIRAEELNDCQ